MTKLKKNLKCDKTQNLKARHQKKMSKTQILTKLKNLYWDNLKCDKNPNVVQINNSKFHIPKKLKM